MKFTRLIPLLLIPFCLSRCTLVSFAPEAWVAGKTPWRKETPPELPRNSMEKMAVEASQLKTALRDGSCTVAFIEEDAGCFLVAAVEDNPQDPDRFAPKKVTRSRVVSGRIAAVSGPSMEPFPDVEFERAVVIAARKAIGSGSSVVPYHDGIHGVTLRGVREGSCLAEVKVLDGFEPRVDPIFTKTVNFCAEK